MEKNELKTAVAEVIKSGDRAAFAELIIEYAQPNQVPTYFMDNLLSTRALKNGDALVKKVRRGIEVRTLVPGTVHLASEVTVEDRINYTLDGADVKVNFSEWDIENGDIGTVQSIRAEMLNKLRNFYTNKVFTALSSVWTAGNTPLNFIDLGTAITATALEDAIDRINAVTPGVKTVVGTRRAMTPITKFAGFWTDGTNVSSIDSTIEEIKQTGRVGKYYGANLQMLEQVYDNPADYNKLIPDDIIIVIGEQVGEFISYGDVKTKQWVDNNPTPPVWNLELYQQFGMILDNVQGIYVIKVTHA